MAPFLAPAFATTAAWACAQWPSSTICPPTIGGPGHRLPRPPLAPVRVDTRLRMTRGPPDDDDERRRADLIQVVGADYARLVRLADPTPADLAARIHEVEAYRPGSRGSMLDKMYKIITLTPEFQQSSPMTDDDDVVLSPEIQALVNLVLAFMHAEILKFDPPDQSRIVAALWVPFALDVDIDRPTLDLMTVEGFRHYTASKTEAEKRIFNLAFRVWDVVIPSRLMQELVNVWNGRLDPQLRASIKREVVLGLMTEIFVTRDAFSDTALGVAPDAQALRRVRRTQQVRMYSILVPLSQHVDGGQKLAQLRQLNALEQRRTIHRLNAAFHFNETLDDGFE